MTDTDTEDDISAWTNDIHQGDALEVLAEMPAESVHAVVTDPPYGLAFMGKSWDDFDPKEYQAWCEEWARLARTVLKPGGHLLAFSGNRTHHRLFSGVEDAGFEIRDTLTWHYGCLSEDTEVLTPDGWRSHDEIAAGDDVVAFDPDTETFAAEPTARVFRYHHDGIMVRYQSGHTDQLVTPNHRVLHFHSGDWQTIYAERSNGIMELPVIHDGRDTGPQGRDNVCKVRRDDAIPAGSGRGTKLLLSGVLSGLAKGGLRHDGPPSRDSTDGTGRVDGGVDGVVPRENERREQPSMEGGRNEKATKGELQTRDYGPVPAGVRGDGPVERVRAGASVEGGKGTWQAAHIGGSGASQGPRQPQQRPRKPGTVAEQSASQVSRGGPRGVPVRTTLARTSRVSYSGTVWCVSVPSSYFVARRNGRAFITGNSGFPKALDVSKAIDKAAGAEREVVGSHSSLKATNGNTYGNYNTDEVPTVTAPATAAAKRWDGWKTHLKPATEFVVMARKPFDGTVAECIQTHGTSALNIDGTRIGTEGGHEHPGTEDNSTTVTAYGDGLNGTSSEPVDKGRYPANVIFDRAAAAALDREVGELSGGAYTPQNHTGRNTSDAPTHNDPDERTPTNSGGPSRYFYTSKATKAERTLDGRIPNDHPTVKPQDLMEWLVKLVSAEGQVVCDPFVGSGTTCMAAKALGRRFVGIEQNPDYVALAQSRVGIDVDDPDRLLEEGETSLAQFTDGGGTNEM